ncbi:OTU domain-containing 6B, putative [Babesia ovata]|uniref:OTU domain-containing 6B, putative n=1 Tax=Babesia ovata TaxID=189622 RepID=A0A2H6KDP7_9APIC|nr:OTU domain-containing 6B, putative [Babesia ovata]GBE61079.1 OTU domain-containing 6B, putative [Babesia ovata]
MDTDGTESFYSEPKQLTAAQRKKLKKKLQFMELEAKIAEEKDNAPDLRAAEDEDLRRQLAAVGKAVFKILGDGNCLFRAVEHQLKQACERGSKLLALSHGQLRHMAIEYIRTHRADYEAFIDTNDSNTSEDGDAFENYCKKMAQDGEWGYADDLGIQSQMTCSGQLEIRALSAVLGCKIVVHAQGVPPMEYVSGIARTFTGQRE